MDFFNKMDSIVGDGANVDPKILVNEYRFPMQNKTDAFMMKIWINKSNKYSATVNWYVEKNVNSMLIVNDTETDDMYETMKKAFKVIEGYSEEDAVIVENKFY